jgi:hypothetical protein
MADDATSTSSAPDSKRPRFSVRFYLLAIAVTSLFAAVLWLMVRQDDEASPTTTAATTTTAPDSGGGDSVTVPLSGGSGFVSLTTADQGAASADLENVAGITLRVDTDLTIARGVIDASFAQADTSKETVEEYAFATAAGSFELPLSDSPVLPADGAGGSTLPPAEPGVRYFGGPIELTVTMDAHQAAGIATTGGVRSVVQWADPEGNATVPAWVSGRIGPTDEAGAAPVAKNVRYQSPSSTEMPDWYVTFDVWGTVAAG